MKISIETPCHENWNSMKPNENGAFCLSCQKSVIDFTTKTTHEIKSFFKSITTTEKVCGRFKTEQLTELSFDDFFERFKKWGLSQKLVVVIFFSFGLTLFSCQSSENTETVYNPTIEVPVKKDSTRAIPTKDTTKIKNTHHTTSIEKEKLELLGDVAFVDPTPKTATLQSTETNIEPMGAVEFINGQVGARAKPNCTPKDSTSKTIKENRMIKGEIRR